MYLNFYTFWNNIIGIVSQCCINGYNFTSPGAAKSVIIIIIITGRTTGDTTITDSKTDISNDVVSPLNKRHV
jgi:hypothetical protein